MSIQERREEAEAVLDSAEMMLETYPGAGEKARELEGKIKELEQELQDPESEAKLRELINDIRDLMEDMKDEPMEPDMGPEEEMGGMGPGDDMPPI
ncbi:MAG: hypothetical protein ABEJ64_03960 [Candidatus Nanohaloarchaea archaeon]